MERIRKVFFFVFLSVLLPAACAFAEEEIEDMVDIFDSDGSIIAVIEGKRSSDLDLRPGESMSWSASRGHAAAVLTNTRFLAISDTSDGWRTFPLRLDESGEIVHEISPCIALVVTVYRTVAFDAKTGRFTEFRLPIRDELIEAKTSGHVAVVITSSRALGFARGEQAFREVPLRIREKVQEIKIASNRATVRTTDRLLVFESSAPGWRELEL